MIIALFILLLIILILLLLWFICKEHRQEITQEIQAIENTKLASDKKDKGPEEIQWDEIIEGDEYIIKKKNGEPLMTLSAVQPGTFVLGHPLVPGPPKKQKKVKLDPIRWYLQPPAEYDPNVYMSPKGFRPYPKATLTRPYFIGQTEVTVEQYKYVMELWNKQRPKLAVNTTPGMATFSAKAAKRYADCDHDPSDCPVDKVSWQEAMYFCRALEDSGLLPKGTKCALPTEIQFEFAARGGNKEYKKYYKYSGTNKREEVIIKYPFPYIPVRKAKPNGLKIYGMSNEFWEWCLDDYVHDIADLKAEFHRFYLDPSEKQRSMRGAYELTSRRSAYRDNMFTPMETKFNFGFIGVGFRIVLIPDKPITEKETTIYKPDQEERIEKDIKPPVITPVRPEKDSFVNIPNPAISANVEDDKSKVTSVVMQIDGKKVQSKYHAGLKIASVRADDLADGVHTVTVSAQDEAGNKSSCSWSFTVDTTPPEYSNFTPAKDAVVADEKTTISVTVTDKLSGVDPKSIVFEVDGMSKNVSFDGKTGTVAFSTEKLSHGTHNAYILAYDNAGNKSSASWKFTVEDKTPPKIIPRSPTPSSFIKIKNPRISAEIIDTQSGVAPDSIRISVSGKTLSANYSRGSRSAVSQAALMNDGVHVIRVSAKDKAGNHNSASWEFTIDTTPPEFRALSPENNAKLPNGNIQISAVVTDKLSGVDEKSIVVRVDGKKLPYQYKSSDHAIMINAGTLSKGRHRVKISAKDHAGNPANASWTFAVATPALSIPKDYFLLKVGSSTLKMLRMKSNNFIVGREIDQQGNIYNDPRTAHKRNIRTRFYIGENEISQAMYKEVITRWNVQNPSRKIDPSPSANIKANYAVTNVSWQEAMIFCEYLNKNNFAPQGYYFSLPTEILWEFAARSCNARGDQNKYYLYSGGNDPGKFVNHHGNCTKQPEMKNLRSNAMQLFDMSGGVMEWCLDDRQDDSKKLRTVYQRRALKPTRPSQTRGGSWRTDLKYCHVISRPPEMAFDKNTRRDDLGFRIVLIKK